MPLEQQDTDNREKICEICKEKISKYCCPRCDILYCSLDCYKSPNHSDCSENFYRDCVNEELASMQADHESKQKMIDILKKMGNEDTEFIEEIDNIDSDDEKEVDLHERLQGLNLEDADAVWNALTEDERNEFQAILSQGDIGSIMPQWEPWWMYRRVKKLVEDVNEKNLDEDALKKCPPLKKVPEFSSMMKSEPSPSIKFNITNVLASYVFIMRYFNGELEPREATTCLLDICDNLNLNINYNDAATSIEAVTQKCAQSELIETDAISVDVMKYDIFLLLQGPSEDNSSYYTKAALSHLHEIFTQAKKNKINNKMNGEFTKKFPEQKIENLKQLDLSKVKKCIKKIEFYLSYVESVGMEFE